ALPVGGCVTESARDRLEGADTAHRSLPRPQRAREEDDRRLTRARAWAPPLPVGGGEPAGGGPPSGLLGAACGAAPRRKIGKAPDALSGMRLIDPRIRA